MLLFTKRARKDLFEIGQYTQKTWGTEQRNKYLSQLHESCQQLALHPEIGRDRSNVREGYRCYYEGRHVIFYQTNSDNVIIIRILHQRMDIELNF